MWDRPFHGGIAITLRVVRYKGFYLPPVLLQLCTKKDMLCVMYTLTVALTTFTCVFTFASAPTLLYNFT